VFIIGIIDCDHAQCHDSRWFDDKENLIHPLTTQDQQIMDFILSNIGLDDSDSLIPISDVYMDMEYYHYMNSNDTFSDLSMLALAHLHFLKVQNKPARYNQMDMDEKRTWGLSTIKTTQNFTRDRLIKDLTRAVRVQCLLVM